MRKNLLVYLILAVGLAGGAYFYRTQLGNWIVSHEGDKFALRGNPDLSLLPPPLRAVFESPNSNLTKLGTIVETNKARQAEGLGPLKENSILDKVAERKLQDMFAQQYFEHVNPQGKGPSDLADAEGYKYILIGENLALGNFADDAVLVDAWMNSPGHRANILNTKYREIGVAVGKGQFEGREVWLAVQSFGASLSLCPQPSASIQAQITIQQRAIDALRAQVETERRQLQAYQKAGDTKSYNRNVGPYNNDVDKLNAMVTALKQLINQYNSGVESFNACVKGNS